jgi:hypothetical protein
MWGDSILMSGTWLAATEHGAKRGEIEEYPGNRGNMDEI